MEWGALSGPLWSWHPHPLAWSLVLVPGGLYVRAARRGPERARERDVALFGLGLFLLYTFLDWPVADLAGRSLLVHLAQQTVLLLAVPPLLLLGTRAWTARLHLPGPLTRVSSPTGATLVFNAVVIVSFLPAVMNGVVRNGAAAAGMDLMLLLAGLVMWAPALRIGPATGRPLSHAGRAAYLIVQSVLPSFASLIFIFARHPVYDVFRDSARSVGLSPVADQQLAGALAKVVGLAVLLGAAGAILLRGDAGSEDDLPPGTLSWDDVERELRRLEGKSGAG
ncbi:MAG TPA: cytochrome c oxidase assembly protein [Acidimicrobiales bacterium]|nr:cytochrome c oxidase assembly protein [Acidimicrobiales bacterium]